MWVFYFPVVNLIELASLADISLPVFSTKEPLWHIMFFKDNEFQELT